jgi:hypothetical protein
MELEVTVGMTLTLDRYNEMLQAENRLKEIESMSFDEIAAKLLSKRIRYFMTERGKPGTWYPWDEKVRGVMMTLPIRVPVCPGENAGEWWYENSMLCVDSIWGKNF